MPVFLENYPFFKDWSLASPIEIRKGEKIVYQIDKPTNDTVHFDVKLLYGRHKFITYVETFDFHSIILHPSIKVSTGLYQLQI